MPVSRVRYVYDIPYTIRRDVCLCLDTTGKWEPLGAEIGFKPIQLDKFRMALGRAGGSAADELLCEWSHLNPTIVKLFTILKKLGLVREMGYLKELVPPKYTSGIKWSDGDLSQAGGTTTQRREPELDSISGNSFDEEDLPGPSEVPQAAARYAPPPPHACPDPHRSKTTSTTDNNQSRSKHSSAQVTQERREQLVNIPCIQLKTAVAGRRTPVESHDVTSDGHLCSSNLLAASNSPKDNFGAAFTFLPHFKYEDIQLATDQFSEKNILGKGGFGTVYHGELKGTACAIKCFNKTAQQKILSCLTEVRELAQLKNKYIVQLSGYCNDKESLCLVYELMENGSLEDRLACKDGTPPLTWQQRHNILTCAARGLVYMHTAFDGKPRLHGDMKSANILLDKHWDAKIGDFGLCREANKGSGSQLTHVTKQTYERFGSVGYMPPEFSRTGQLSVRTDVHCFGVVIIEVCTGVLASSTHELRNDMEAIMEENVQEKTLQKMDSSAGHWPADKWLRLLKLGMECAHNKPKKRPSMETVLLTLKSLMPNPAEDSGSHHEFHFHEEGVGKEDLNEVFEKESMADATPGNKASLSDITQDDKKHYVNAATMPGQQKLDASHQHRLSDTSTGIHQPYNRPIAYPPHATYPHAECRNTSPGKASTSMGSDTRLLINYGDQMTPESEPGAPKALQSYPALPMDSPSFTPAIEGASASSYQLSVSKIDVSSTSPTGQCLPPVPLSTSPRPSFSMLLPDEQSPEELRAGFHLLVVDHEELQDEDIDIDIGRSNFDANEELARKPKKKGALSSLLHDLVPETMEDFTPKFENAD